MRAGRAEIPPARACLSGWPKPCLWARQIYHRFPRTTRPGAIVERQSQQPHGQAAHSLAARRPGRAPFVAACHPPTDRPAGNQGAPPPQRARQQCARLKLNVTACCRPLLNQLGGIGVHSIVRPFEIGTCTLAFTSTSLSTSTSTSRLTFALAFTFTFTFTFCVPCWRPADSGRPAARRGSSLHYLAITLLRSRSCAVRVCVRVR